MTNLRELLYRIDVDPTQVGQLQVQLEFAPDFGPSSTSPEAIAPSTTLFLPTWTPGIYLIREYSRHLSRVEAEDAETAERLPCIKTAKNRFRIDGRSGTRRVRIRYRVYAHELSVRTADVTDQHAYWNHACVLLWPIGDLGRAAQITVSFPADWRLACALPTTAIPPDPDSTTRTVRMSAECMDRAVDAPCLVGRFEEKEWHADGVRHSIALDGLAAVEPPPTLVQDLGRIVEAARNVFDGKLPYASYAFLCLFAADGHGGLEHGDSTTLLMSRTALSSEKGYRDFLSLAAHELFHAWNVKRMRPAEFWHYDYEAENYTEFLWLIEGWTAYYDDLLCMRAGLLGREDYLAIVSKNIQTMLGAPGRLRLSLRESSFDAWIRLYRPDENTRNSSQNYYGNGAVAAMCLDLQVRSATAGKFSLDDVLRRLYSQTFGNGRGYAAADVEAAIREFGGEAAVQAMASMVGKQLDPDLTSLLANFGVRLVRRDAERPFLGVQFEASSTTVASVTAGSPAHDAGIQPGDEILALSSLRVDSGRWQDVFQATARVGKPLAVLLARRGVVSVRNAIPQPSPGTIALEIDEGAPPAARSLRDGWLKQLGKKDT